MASSSSSSNAQGIKYDVFISFRGADVRNNFLSHLLAALKRKQIEAFVDDTDLERGKPIAPTLLKTIEESYVSIVIFSKSYPHSEWCLDELHKILQCMEKKNQIAVPLFYDVDPSVVQDLQQNYALSIYAGKVQDLKLENWRNALREISNLSGFNSADPKHKPEAKLCDEITKDVSKKLSVLSESYALNYGLFDIDSRIEDVESLIEREENNVTMIGIWGMGGIGKTTLAGNVFNRIKNNFYGYCFVLNVREKLSNRLTTHDLRDEIIRKLLRDESIKPDSPNMIDENIRRRLKDKKVLIVLDDVDDPMHLKSVLEDSGLCSPGMLCAKSRIIVTGRDRQVFENVPMNKHIYQVKQLNNNQALQLFSRRVFGQSYPQEEYKELSEKVVKYAQGLPLALVVLSADLKGKGPEIWVDKLKKIEDIPLGNIQRILRTSFNGLDRDEKRIFLDIACFFKGHAVKDVERILKCFDFYSTDGIDRLRDKSLISISQSYETIEMHDLIQQMGQEIVAEESGQKIEKQSRLWKLEDILYVLRTDRGTENVEGISLNIGELDGDSNISSKAFINMHKLRFLRLFDYFYFVNLDRNEVYLPDGLEFLPNSLRYLKWSCFPLSRLPSNFTLDELVELDMPRSKLEELVWDKPPRNLKRICLSNSKDLIKISNLGEALNLEIIDLSVCENLVDIGSSLENLHSLIELHLVHCRSLYKIPEVPCNIKDLYLRVDPYFHYDDDDVDLNCLEFSGFSKLTSLPNTIFNLGSKFKKLDVSKLTNLNMLPEDLGNLKFLERLKASSSGLKELPSSICNLRSLKSLHVCNCENLNKLPDNLGTLESLEILGASNSALEELPSSFGNLRSLKSLDISGCNNLNKLPDNLGTLESLEELDASNSDLKELPSSFCNLRSLKSLDISYCENLNKLPDNLGTLESLERLVASNSALEELPSSFCNLRSLNVLHISGCNNLNKLPDNLGTLEFLETLHAFNSALKELPSSFCNLRSLKNLAISYCQNLNKLPDNLGTLESLEWLNASDCALEELPSSFCKLRSLKSLDVSDCNNLNKLPDNLWTLESLEKLDVSGIGLEELPNIPQNLKTLRAANCKSLKSVPTRFKLPLALLDLRNCQKLNEEASSIILQSLRESQYLSTDKCNLCIVGSEVPQWMEYRNSSSSSLSFEFDTRGNSIWFIFCAVIVAVDDRSCISLKACLTDKCGNEKAYSPPTSVVVIDSNLEHVILWHRQIDHSVREASFEIVEYSSEKSSTTQVKIKSIGVHPIVERGDEDDETQRRTKEPLPLCRDRKRKREEEESTSDINLNLSLSLPHSS